MKKDPKLKVVTRKYPLIEEMKRERVQRGRIYGKWIRDGRMTAEEAIVRNQRLDNAIELAELAVKFRNTVASQPEPNMQQWCGKQFAAAFDNILERP